MSEASKQVEQQQASERLTAGLLLRQARQSRGLHIAALATSIKVTPRKLELLESDRYDELLDLTFTRALAQTVCRSLKIDPAPVLALLPKSSGGQLDHVESGINQPFLERSGRSGRPGRVESQSWKQALKPQWLLPGLLVFAAGGMYFLPGSLTLDSENHPPATAEVVQGPAADMVPAVAVTAALQQTPVELLPPPDVSSAGLSAPPATPAEAASAAVASLLELRASQGAWVEVQDANSKPLLARLLQAGEVVNLDGTPPLRLKVGNAANTTVRFRGQPIDLAPSTRDNVARIELK
jgi:cytoskeleton protein RodZ